MFIKSWTGGPFATNSYIIADKEGIGAIIDPTFDSLKPLSTIAAQHKIKIVAIYLTHSHHDHIADVASLKKMYSCPVFIHELDSPNLIRPGADGLRLPLPIEGAHPDYLWEENKEYHCGELAFEVIHTPGHSPGGVCLYFKKEAVLISGDTLFKGTIGRLDLPGSSSEDMFASLKKLEKLPEDVKVYPGHGSSTTIKEEKKWLSKASLLYGD
jgi:hydroxyacylglutathione hydrolase